MPKIRIENLFNKSFSFQAGTKTTLQLLHENKIDWMHACGGKGNCTTCTMMVMDGMENLSRESEAEKRFRRHQKLPEGCRLACQCSPKGDLVIQVPKIYQLPHQSYSS